MTEKKTVIVFTNVQQLDKTKKNHEKKKKKMKQALIHFSRSRLVYKTLGSIKNYLEINL